MFALLVGRSLVCSCDTPLSFTNLLLLVVLKRLCVLALYHGPFNPLSVSLDERVMLALFDGGWRRNLDDHSVWDLGVCLAVRWAKSRLLGVVYLVASHVGRMALVDE